MFSLLNSKPANSIRKILALFSFLSLLILYLWNYERPFVNWAGGRFAKLYSSHYRTRFKRAMKQLKKDPESGIVVLQSYLKGLSDIKKGDTLAIYKSRSFEALFLSFRDGGRKSEALSILEEWVDFDDKDLFAKKYNIQFQLSNVGSSKVRESESSDLYELSSELFAEEYCHVLIVNRQYEKARLVLRKYFNICQRKAVSWFVFWDTGQGFSAGEGKSVVPEVDSQFRTVLNFSLPLGIQRLRIDLPEGLRYLCTNSTFSKHGSGKSTTWKIQNLKPEFHDISDVGFGLLAECRSDPFFHFALPGNSSAGNSSCKWSFSTTAVSVLSAWFLKNFPIEDYKYFKKVLEKNKDQDILYSFKLIRDGMLHSSAGQDYD